MTVTTTTVQSGPYTPNGVTISFPYLFKPLSEDEVQVVRVADDGAETVLSGYRLSSITSTGAAVFDTPPAAGGSIFVRAIPSFLQPIDFENQGVFNASDHNAGLDRGTQRSLFLLRLLTNAAGIFGLTVNQLANFTPAAARALAAQVFKGDPGGNVMAVGLFSALGGMSIPVGTDVIQTSGYDAVGRGPARYTLDSDQVTATATRTRAKSLNNRWFRLAEAVPNVTHLGAYGDGIHDDTAAITFGASFPELFFPDGTFMATDNITITAVVRMSEGAAINVATGKAVAFRGGFYAPRRAPVFQNCTAGLGSVTFNPRYTVEGHPEWWGAQADNAGNDSLPALKACAAAVPTTLLGGGTYYISNTWLFSRNDGKVIGVGQNYGGGASSIICLTGANAATNATFWFGAETYGAVVRGMFCSDVEFTRTGTANGSASGDAEDCVKAVIYRYATNSEMRRCRAMGAPIGFHVSLTATSNLIDCNYNPAASSSNDICIGFLFGGYNTYPGFVGSNGSLRAEGNTCFGLPASTWTAHTLVYGLPADTWIDKHEGNGGKRGLVVVGLNQASMIDYLANGAGARTILGGAGSSQDITLANCRMDGYSSGAFVVRYLDANASVNISNPYVAASGTGFSLISVFGRIWIAGGEALASAPGQVGLNANAVTMLSLDGLYLRDFSSPVVLASLNSCEVRPVIYNPSNTATHAVNLTTCSRSVIAPQVHGAATRFTNGVSVDAGSGFNLVDGTMIDYGGFVTVDAAQKVRYAGADARGGFGSNVLAGVTG